MKNQFKITMFLLLLGLMGCTSKYIPTMVNTPMISEKGEIQGGVYTAYNAFSPRFAYGITDNIAIAGTGQFLIDGIWDTDEYYGINYGEISLGYFTKFDEIFNFDVYGGYGYGNYKWRDKIYDNYLESEYTYNYFNYINRNIFIQPSIGLKFKYFQINFASKIEYRYINDASKKEDSFFMTGMTTYKGGVENFKFVVQLGFTRNIGSNLTILDYYWFHFNIGLEFNIFTKGVFEKRK